MPLSPQEVAKRALVSLLLFFARSDSLAVDVRRGSPDPDVVRAFKRVARAVHPDKGGRLQDQQRFVPQQRGVVNLWYFLRNEWRQIRAHTHT